MRPSRRHSPLKKTIDAKAREIIQRIYASSPAVAPAFPDVTRPLTAATAALGSNYPPKAQFLEESGETLFNPGALTDLVLWLRGDLGITESGGNISEWADQSGHGNNFAQAVMADQPTVAAGINGNATVLFNGTTQFMTSAGQFAVGAKSLAIVFKATSDPGASTFYSMLLLQDTTGACSETLLVNDAGYEPYTFGVDIGAATPAEGIANALDLNAHGFIWTFNGATYTALLDNTPESVVASGDLGYAGQVTSIGARNNGSFPFAGQVAEVIVVSRAFTAADEAALHAYFNARYGPGVG
jgi:hypothetical protein